MRIKAAVQNKVTRSLFSIERRNAARAQAERTRLKQNGKHVVEYFHEAGDPYSHLLVQLLPAFRERYEVDLKVHVTAPPPDWAAPDRARLNAYARKDAERLAQRGGLSFVDPGQQPSASVLTEANKRLVKAAREGTFLKKAFEIGQQMWTHPDAHKDVSSDPDLDAVLDQAAMHRDELGHYLGGMLYYAGEWYWGIDRLHFLEARLRELGAAKTQKTQFLFPPHEVERLGLKASSTERPELHWYLSFRSPYTGIVAARVKAIADAFGADLKLRYVLPMVMRGMQVPRKKGFYIMKDTVREAERQGIPFGNSVDPVGEPVERGYAILHAAIREGKGFEFAQSFLSGVWADGLDAGSNSGLRKITERAGLDWSHMKSFLGSDHWRAEADANQKEMFDYGLWGVPSFRVGDVAAWGQDRLWVIEGALNTHARQQQEI